MRLIIQAELLPGLLKTWVGGREAPTPPSLRSFFFMLRLAWAHSCKRGRARPRSAKITKQNCYLGIFFLHNIMKKKNAAG
jgi:hypothetical protein